MRSNDFRVDTTPSASPSILRRRQTLLGLALLLTIPQMISAVYLPIRWTLDAKAGAALNVAHLASNELYFLVMSIAGAAVLKMMLSDATFSRTLVRCTRAGTLGGVPRSLPAMVKAFRVGEKAAATGFDWQRREDVWDKVKEEIAEVEAEMRSEAPGSREKLEGEFGDLFFALVNASRLYGIDPESALERTNKKFIRRFNYMEEKAAAEGHTLHDLPLEKMEEYWQEAKHEETFNSMCPH